MDVKRIEPKRKYDLSYIAWDCGFPFNNCGNFSLVQMSNGNYFAIFRMFGYYIDGDGRYLTNKDLLLENPHQHTFVELDKDFRIVRRLDNVFSDYFGMQTQTEKAWLEDGRLVRWCGKLYLSSTVCYQRNGGWNAVGLEVQELEFDGDNVMANHYWNTFEHGIGGIQKNWLPIQSMPFHYIIGTSPHGTQVIDIRNGILKTIGDTSGDFYRGNTPLMKTNDGHMAILHKVLPACEERPIKTYVNYFAEYGNNLCPKKFSKAFKLCDSNIEFVTTMLELPNNELLIGVTEMDETPYAMIFDKDTILDSCK